MKDISNNSLTSSYKADIGLNLKLSLQSFIYQSTKMINYFIFHDAQRIGNIFQTKCILRKLEYTF